MTDWQPIETALKGREMLVYYKNKYGKERIVRARYYPPETLESEEMADEEWAPEGWYEESDTHDILRPVDGEPTHWMHLPPPPTELHRHAGITAASFDSAVDVSLEKNPINS
jgi:hypothetical protein